MNNKRLTKGRLFLRKLKWNAGYDENDQTFYIVFNKAQLKRVYNEDDWSPMESARFFSVKETKKLVEATECPLADLPLLMNKDPEYGFEKLIDLVVAERLREGI